MSSQKSEQISPIDRVPPGLRLAFREAASILGLTDDDLLRRCIERGIAEQLRDLNAIHYWEKNDDD